MLQIELTVSIFQITPGGSTGSYWSCTYRCYIYSKCFYSVDLPANVYVSKTPVVFSDSFYMCYRLLWPLSDKQLSYFTIPWQLLCFRSVPSFRSFWHLLCFTTPCQILCFRFHWQLQYTRPWRWPLRGSSVFAGHTRRRVLQYLTVQRFMCTNHDGRGIDHRVTRVLARSAFWYFVQ
jgi:hypothetical protein